MFGKELNMTMYEWTYLMVRAFAVGFGFTYGALMFLLLASLVWDFVKRLTSKVIK